MSHDAKEVLDFIDFSHMTTAVGYDQEDGGERSKLADLEAALAEKEARIETLCLSLDVIVERFAGLGLRAEDADEASLMAADRIREKEAALVSEKLANGRLFVEVGDQGEKIHEQEAALAAAHEAIRVAMKWLGNFGAHAPVLFGGEAELDATLGAALSAPALQSAAKLDRLRREVVGAAQANEDFLYEHGDPSDFWSREVNEAYNLLHARLEAALAALRAEEENP